MNSRTYDIQESKITKGRKQKFRNAWLQQYPWLEKKDERPYCKRCSRFLTICVANLQRHENSEKHLKREIISQQQGATDLPEKPKIIETKILPNTQQLKSAESKLSMFLLEHNLSSSLMGPLISLMKSVAPDSSIIAELKLNTMKAAIFERSDIETVLQCQKFSLILDETCSKYIIIVVRYFDYNYGKLLDKYFGYLNVDNATEKRLPIFEAIVSYLSFRNIPLSNMIGIAADKTILMLENKSDDASVFMEAFNPDLIIMEFTCQSMQLCTTAAGKRLPNKIEAIIKGIYIFFAHGSRRQSEFRELQEHFNFRPNKSLKSSTNRWLSQDSVLIRILDQWDSLKRYFLAYELEYNASLAQTIADGLTDETKIYLFFLKYVLKLSNNINLEYQLEQPKIYAFLKNVKSHLKTLLLNFIKPEFIEDYILNGTDILNEFLLETNEIYIGAQAHILISEQNITEVILNDIRSKCKEYYMELCKEIRQRIEFGHGAFDALQILDPTMRAPSIAPLLKYFPNLVAEDLYEELDAEWRAVRHELCQNIYYENLPVELYWSNIFKIRNAEQNGLMFPNLRQFVSCLISLPLSSANTERIFIQALSIKDLKQ